MKDYKTENFGAQTGCLILVGLVFIIGGYHENEWIIYGGLLFTFVTYMWYINDLLRRMALDLSPSSGHKSE